MAKKISCVLVCASPELGAELVKSVVSDDDYVIAADGGMNVLNEAEIIPDLFVGDFDSFSGSVPEGTEVLKLNVRKDDTDSMRCASLIAERGFERVVILGATGGRGDHTFANYFVLEFLASKGIDAVIRTEAEEIRILDEGEHSFNNLNGRTFSVFPFSCESVRVTYTGDTEYPAEGLVLHNLSTVGTSNVFRGDNAVIKIESGRAIVFNSLKKL